MTQGDEDAIVFHFRADIGALTFPEGDVSGSCDTHSLDEVDYVLSTQDPPDLLVQLVFNDVQDLSCEGLFDAAAELAEILIARLAFAANVAIHQARLDLVRPPSRCVAWLMERKRERQEPGRFLVELEDGWFGRPGPHETIYSLLRNALMHPDGPREKDMAKTRREVARHLPDFQELVKGAIRERSR